VILLRAGLHILGSLLAARLQAVGLLLTARLGMFTVLHAVGLGSGRKLLPARLKPSRPSRHESPVRRKASSSGWAFPCEIASREIASSKIAASPKAASPKAASSSTTSSKAAGVAASVSVFGG
jgi:hypothetical protein